MTGSRLPLAALAIGLLAGLLCGQCQGSISVSPGFVEVQLDKGRPTGEFTITNLGDKEERFRILCTHFNFSVDGTLDRVAPDDHSLARWTIFNPKEFTLPPSSKRVVRFVITPRGEMRPGEYWCAMELESLNTTVSHGQDSSGHGMKLEVIPTVLVPMFGTVGVVTHQTTVQEVKTSVEGGRPVVVTHLTNTGTGRLFLTGKYEVSDAGGKIVDKGGAGATYVFSGTQRNLKAPIRGDLPNGQYAISVIYTSPQLSEPITAVAKLDWTKPSAAAPPVQTPPASAASPDKQPAATSAPSVVTPEKAPTSGGAADRNPPKTQPQGSATSDTGKDPSFGAEGPKAAIAKSESPKAIEQPNPAPAAPAPRNAEAPKATAVNPDLPKVDAPKTVAAKPDLPKVDAAKTVAAKPDLPKVDATRVAATVPKPVRADPPKSTVARIESPKVEITRATSLTPEQPVVQPAMATAPTAGSQKPPEQAAILPAATSTVPSARKSDGRNDRIGSTVRVSDNSREAPSSTDVSPTCPPAVGVPAGESESKVAEVARAASSGTDALTTDGSQRPSAGVSSSSQRSARYRSHRGRARSSWWTRHRRHVRSRAHRTSG